MEYSFIVNAIACIPGAVDIVYMTLYVFVNNICIDKRDPFDVIVEGHY